MHFGIQKALASLVLGRSHFHREEYAFDSPAKLSQMTGLLAFLLGQVVQHKRTTCDIPKKRLCPQHSSFPLLPTHWQQLFCLLLPPPGAGTFPSNDSYFCPITFSVFSIRVKRAPKPVPVKRRRPTARRFYLMEPVVLLVYIFVTAHHHPTY